MKTAGGRRVVAVIVLVCGLARSAAAIYLDEEQNVSLRARIYSQGSVRLPNSVFTGKSSQEDTVPAEKAGQVVSHRNFYNPELEAKLTKWTGGLADDFSFRLAAWGFYDGVYDYGPRQFKDTARQINATFGDYSLGKGLGHRAWFIEGPSFEPRSDDVKKRTNSEQVAFNALFPGHEVQNARDIYGRRERINELYLNYSKGPVFLRVGKQAISWGESDTIALLDQNNPFDLTLGAPGVFEDLDEARIPLWTARGSLTLFESLGPFSSGFVEGYLVPGDLDTNTGILPVLTASPYSVRGNDPNNLSLVNGLQFVLFDHRPPQKFEKSRWGFRVQTVVGRNYTVQAWYYTHFPNGPVPIKQPLITIGPTTPPGTAATSLFIIETAHRLTHVAGAATTFFLEPLDGIVRAEAEYFFNEPGFVPEKNLSLGPNALKGVGELQHADIVRFELGFDRFFFLRPVNPSNSILLVTAIVGAVNLDETPQRDFYMNGQQKPGQTGTSPADFVQQKQVEAFGQVHMQTDYMHGRLTPAITVIGNRRGTYAVQPTLTYRFYDWLLFDLNAIHIGGEYQQLGFFRDRGQLSARVTYQLN
jgi:hypothetical protein